MAQVRNSKSLPDRFDRQTWLAQALNVLAREGNTRITVRHISETLGVTTGSFYWHFKNRSEFVRSIIDYWNEVYTEKVAEHLMSVSGGPRAQLLELMKFITREDMARHDIAIRAWAAQDINVARAVKKVDQRRFEIVRSLFAAMGFEGAELDMRSRIFIVYHSLDLAVYPRQSKKARLEALERRHAWFTRS